jgi:O6-methylguanine-DNA--protein-cysteine methyltransferase
VSASGHALKILVKIMLQRTEMTPFGLINMSSNGKAITNLTWLETKPETATDPKTGNKDHHNSDAILDQAFQELHEYANGTRQIFTVPVSLDSPHTSASGMAECLAPSGLWRHYQLC